MTINKDFLMNLTFGAIAFVSIFTMVLMGVGTLFMGFPVEVGATGIAVSMALLSTLIFFIGE